MKGFKARSQILVSLDLTHYKEYCNYRNNNNNNATIIIMSQCQRNAKDCAIRSRLHSSTNTRLNTSEIKPETWLALGEQNSN